MLKPTTISKRLWAVGGLALLFFFEFIIFDQIGAHHHTWVYPRWNDQIQYLTEAYLGYENVRAHGLWTSLSQTLVNPTAQGKLHEVGAMLLFSVTGPSRSAALSLNMLALIAWQTATFFVVARTARSYAAGFVAAGLLLALKSAWRSDSGSAFDFRLDWMAACMFGLALAAAQFTNRFRQSGPSIIFGVSVAVAVLTRFLTGTYFVVIYLLFAVWVVRGTERGRGLGNLLLSGIVAAAIAGPVLWPSRETVYNYYFIGHFTGPESALRSENMGVFKSAQWLFESFFQIHVGAEVAILAVILSTLLIVLLFFKPVRADDPGFEPVGSLSPIFPSFAFFIAPALVLILHSQKSAAVLSILLPGMAGLLTWIIAQMMKAVRPRTNQALAWGTVGVVAIGFLVTMRRNPHSDEFLQSARKVASIADTIAHRSEQAGLNEPRIAVDRVTDCLDAQVLRVICYERQHRWIRMLMMLPTGLSEDRPALYWERLAISDFVFLTEDGNSGYWPYDHQLAAMRPETLSWAKEHMKQVESFSLPGIRMTLFERRVSP